VCGQSVGAQPQGVRQKKNWRRGQPPPSDSRSDGRRTALACKPLRVHHSCMAVPVDGARICPSSKGQRRPMVSPSHDGDRGRLPRTVGGVRGHVPSTTSTSESATHPTRRDDSQLAEQCARR